MTCGLSPARNRCFPCGRPKTRLFSARSIRPGIFSLFRSLKSAKRRGRDGRRQSPARTDARRSGFSRGFTARTGKRNLEFVPDDRALVSRLRQARVKGQVPFFKLGLRPLPFGQTGLDLLIGDMEVQLPGGDVDGDWIPVPADGQRTSLGGFGGTMDGA